MIKAIDILIYPFYAQGFELETEVGARKCRQWIKNMQAAAKNKETAFVVSHIMTPSFLSMHTTRSKELFKRFFEAFKVLKKMGLAHSSYSNANIRDVLEISRAFEKNSFASNVKIRYYGQHAGSCVTAVGKGIADYLEHWLKIKKGVQVVTSAEHRALSIKSMDFDAVRMLRHAVPPEEMTEFLNAVRDKKASIYSLRNPNKVKEIVEKRRRKINVFVGKKSVRIK